MAILLLIDVATHTNLLVDTNANKHTWMKPVKLKILI